MNKVDNVVEIALDTDEFDKKINKPLTHTKREERILQKVYKQGKKKKT